MADALDELAGGGSLQPVGWPEGQALTGEALISQGRFFTAPEVLDESQVCVLGYDTWLDLFQGDDPIGETIIVARGHCVVIGVMVELETVDPSQRNSAKPNDAVYMPISTATHLLFDEEPSISITAHVSDESKMDLAKSQIASYLRKRHAISPDETGNYIDDFNITTRKDILGAQQESARTLSLLLTSMAVVSLIVGGIGIMNVMLVSVTERTREIGVRMAIGARQRDIVTQFLLESVLISAIGGVIGIALGVLTIPLAASLNQGNALLEPTSVPLSFGISLATGVVFGLYPAFRAAHLDPIEALRYE
jgi:ABC-type antimicrobial peptide transport system permease subunit